MPLLPSIVEKPRTREGNPKQGRDKRKEWVMVLGGGMKEIFIAGRTPYRYSNGFHFVSYASNQ
jgi:hypothetical protein